MPSILLNLKIEKDNEFSFPPTIEYSAKLYGRSASTIVSKFKEIESQFLLTQKNNYNKTEVFKTLELIEKLYNITNQNIEYIYYSTGSYYLKGFLSTIEYRINLVTKERFKNTRSIKSILGNFEESISPNMIHKILTWLKKENFSKYGSIKRGIKEQIIIDLKKHNIFINPKFLCDFIDKNNPMLFVKEWKIQTHINGKRLKNVQIRELFKKAFYKREKECIRFRIIYPSLNCLPKNVENLIISYIDHYTIHDSV